MERSSHPPQIEQLQEETQQQARANQAAQQVFSDSSDEEKYGPDEADELYDEEADEADAKWVDNHWRKEATQQGTSQGAETDAILNCPCCFTTLCMDCQRHTTYKNQYRAMFTVNCTVKTNLSVFPGQDSAQKKGQQVAADDKKGKTPSEKGGNQSKQVQWHGTVEALEEAVHPVVCESCGTEVGVQDKEDIFHFFNVIAS